MQQTSVQQYNTVAKAIHWITALAIVVMLALGWIMTSIDNSNPHKFAFFQWHKSIGISILLLSLFRVIWRLTHKVPPLPAGMAAWERFAADFTHMLFYILLIVMPVTGWVIVSTSKFNIPTKLFYVIPWPHLPILPTLENKMEINNAAGYTHGMLAFLIAGLFVLHAGAAWKHHLFNRDDVLLRMAPRFMARLLKRIGGPRLPLALFVVACLLLAVPANAHPWKVDYAQSHIAFTSAQDGSAFTGGFKQFDVDIDMDPAHPDGSKIVARIDIASATAGSSERDSYLPQPDWFDTKKFPQAVFTSDVVHKAESAGCFEAQGTLTIKAIPKAVTLPFCLTPEGDHMRAEGTITLQRTDFALGLGQWSDDSLVKHAVVVSISLSAKPN